jgi:hypothetical protein
MASSLLQICKDSSKQEKDGARKDAKKPQGREAKGLLFV